VVRCEMGHGEEGALLLGFVWAVWTAFLRV